jgi:cyclophilin family peptidyl-prolyl cis-trans isomerase
VADDRTEPVEGPEPDPDPAGDEADDLDAADLDAEDLDDLDDADDLGDEDDELDEEDDLGDEDDDGLDEAAAVPEAGESGDGTGRPRSRRAALIAAVVAVVVAAVVAGVLVTRSGGGSSAVAAPTNPGPKIGDHWHAFLGLAVCSTNYTTVPSSAAARGLFTAADGTDPGVVHIQPTAPGNAGANATVDQFLSAFAVSIANGQILSSGTPYPPDGQCADTSEGGTTGPGRLTWTLNGTARRGDPGAYVPADGDVILVSFNPAGTTPTPPPNIAELLAQPAGHPDLATAQAQLACISQPAPTPPAQAHQFTQADQVIDPAKTYTATISTSCGDVTIALDAVHAPTTVNNFVFLARKGFYDGTPIHRIVPGFVVQAGDPTGQGNGGPGYTFADENLTAGYHRGTVAMANAGKGDDGAGTNGSQFFIVTSDDGAAQLTPDYSVFGTVTGGADVVAVLDSFGDAANQDGVPLDLLYILRVTITET